MRRTLPALLIGLLALAAWSETSPLTWQDCIRLAARNNPDLIASLRAMEASRAQYNGSFSGILPKVTLSNTYTDSSASGSTESKVWGAQGTASLDLVDLGQWANIQAASASLKQSQANLEVSSTNTKHPCSDRNS